MMRLWAAIAVVGILAGWAGAADMKPMTISGARQLFVDDYLIQKMGGCRLVVHPGEKDPNNPLTGDADVIPGEREGYWLAGRRGANYPIPKDAAGKDLIPYLYCPCVFHDVLTPDPEERYKLAIWGADGLLIAFSKDGEKWNPWGPKPVTWWLRDVLSPGWDPINKRFLLYCQINVVDLPRYSGRVAGVAWSKDFRTWTPIGIVLRPDKLDPPGMQIHCMSGYWYESVFIGFPQMFQTQPERTAGKILEADEIAYVHIQLATSRDGEHWQRGPERTPIIPLGSVEKGDFDTGFITTAARALQVGDEIWLHYRGSSRPQITGGRERHTPEELAPIDKVPRKGGSGITRWRLDGWVSARADGDGVLTTKPMIAAGGQLLVNANASKGRLLVEILDENSNPIPGLAKADVEPLTADEIHHVVKFQGKDDFLKGLAGKTISLRFHLKDSDLYSFQFKGAPNPIEPIVVGPPAGGLAQLPPVTTEDEAVKALEMAMPFPAQGRTYDAKRICRAVLPEVDGWVRVRPLVVKLGNNELMMFDEMKPVILRWLERKDLSELERGDLRAALFPIMQSELNPVGMAEAARSICDNPKASLDARRKASAIVMENLARGGPETASMDQVKDAMLGFEFTLPTNTDRYISHEYPVCVLRNIAMKDARWSKHAPQGVLPWGAIWFPEPDYVWYMTRMKQAFEFAQQGGRFAEYEKYFNEGPLPRRGPGADSENR